MKWIVVVCFSALSGYVTAKDPQSFIFGDPPGFRELTKPAESSAWAWCSATADFSADLLSRQEEKDPVIVELTNMALASENAIFSLYWWEYEMRLYRKRDSLRHTAGAHQERMEEFREVAKEMIDERRDRIYQASRGDPKEKEMLKRRIRETLALCEGNVESMEYYSQLWNGWMAANRAKLNF